MGSVEEIRQALKSQFSLGDQIVYKNCMITTSKVIVGISEEDKIRGQISVKAGCRRSELVYLLVAQGRLKAYKKNKAAPSKR